MLSFIRRIRMRSLRAKVDESRNRSADLAGKFHAAATDAEKNRLARRYDRALQHAHHMQRRLERLERKERPASASFG